MSGKFCWVRFWLCIGLLWLVLYVFLMARLLCCLLWLLLLGHFGCALVFSYFLPLKNPCMYHIKLINIMIF